MTRSFPKGGGAAIVLAGQARHEQIGESAEAQASCRADQQRAEEGRAWIRAGQHSIINQFADPAENDEKSEKAANERADHHSGASLDGAHPEYEKQRHGQRKDQAEEVGQENALVVNDDESGTAHAIQASSNVLLRRISFFIIRQPPGICKMQPREGKYV